VKEYGFRYRIKIQFQDVLALMVVMPFLGLTVLAFLGEKDTEILRIYSPLILTILGGYFGQGAIRQWGESRPHEITPSKPTEKQI